MVTSSWPCTEEELNSAPLVGMNVDRSLVVLRTFSDSQGDSSMISNIHNIFMFIVKAVSLNWQGTRPVAINETGKGDKFNKQHVCTSLLGAIRINNPALSKLIFTSHIFAQVTNCHYVGGHRSEHSLVFVVVHWPYKEVLGWIKQQFSMHFKILTDTHINLVWHVAINLDCFWRNTFQNCVKGNSVNKPILQGGGG